MVKQVTRLGLLVALVALALSACTGGDAQENKKSASGGSADMNGQIAFRGWFDPDHIKAAL